MVGRNERFRSEAHPPRRRAHDRSRLPSSRLPPPGTASHPAPSLHLSRRERRLGVAIRVVGPGEVKGHQPGRLPRLLVGPLCHGARTCSGVGARGERTGCLARFGEPAERASAAGLFLLLSGRPRPHFYPPCLAPSPVQPLAWFLLALVAVFRLNVEYLLIVAIALGLSITNLWSYFRCSNGELRDTYNSTMRSLTL